MVESGLRPCYPIALGELNEGYRMASVRIFGYPGIVQIEKRLQKQFSSDSVQMRMEPYNWSVQLTLNGLTPVTMPAQANDTATVVFVEVDDNVAVRYELNPPGSSRSPSNVDPPSPKLQGEQPFQWFKGATMSFIDVTGL